MLSKEEMYICAFMNKPFDEYEAEKAGAFEERALSINDAMEAISIETISVAI